MNKIQGFLKRFSKLQLTIITVILVILLMIGSFFIVLNVNTSPVQSKSEIVLFEVVEGDHLDSITNKLEKAEIIKSAMFAKLSAKLNGYSNFILGQFKIDKNWSSNKILQYLTKSKNIVKDEKMLTFPENLWAKDIAKILGDHLEVTSDELLSLWNDPVFLDKCIEKYEFLDESILNDHYRVKLEGYLYPETYSFNIHATPEEITYTFLDHFNDQYQEIKDIIKEAGMKNMHEVITMASVVQFESKSKEDMQMIAGVFFNRMEKGMNLGSSVTVCYAMYDYSSWEECENNTQIDSPYNTYLHNGLPIGPILNPGKDAIEAVLKPKKNDYLYFIADVNNVRGEGKGKVYYSKTGDEHLNLQEELGLIW